MKFTPESCAKAVEMMLETVEADVVGLVVVVEATVIQDPSLSEKKGRVQARKNSKRMIRSPVAWIMT